MYPPPHNNAPEEYQFSKDNSIDIWRYLHIFFIHKWLFIGVFLLTILLVFAYYMTNQNEEIYTSTEEMFYVKFGGGSGGFTQTNSRIISISSGSDNSKFDKNFWLSVMRSREALKLTIENSQLPLNSQSEKWGLQVNIKQEEDSKSLSSFGEAPVFLVSVFSTNKKHVPVLANAFVKSMNELLTKYHVENSKKTVNFIKTQLNENNKKLKKIDRKIMEQQSSNPYLERDINEMVADIESFRTDLQNAHIELASTKAGKAKTESELTSLDGTITSESSFSEPLKVQLMNLHVDLARAKTRNTDDHPNVIAIKDNIRQIKQMLNDSIEQRMEIRSEAIDPVKQQLKQRFLEQTIREISLEARIESLKAVIDDIESKVRPDTMNTNHQQLARNREMILNTINHLNAKLINIQSEAQGGKNRFTIIDEPQVPVEPEKDDNLMMIAVALLLGLVTGGGSIILYDYIDNRIMLIQDYERFYNYPVIGTVPFIKQETFESIVNKMKNNLDWRQDEFATITVNVLQSLKNSSSNTIALCSPVRSEGKSSTTIKLARYLSENNRKVLMIDFDLFDPGMTRELNSKNPGLTEYLMGEINKDEMVQQTEVKNMFYVASGKINADKDIIDYDNNKIKEFLTWASENYDIVVIDTPAVLFIPDITFLLDHVGAIIPVIRLKYTSRRSFDSMLTLMKQHNRKKIIGTIVRNMQYFKMGKYSYYRYYTGYKYKGYYE
ncbi:MAG: AAA family ATPase [Bacteroidales bacterium]|nr:AAA family ATPase [Bacteroidales bacterium]MCF8328197.1 AAA family ATPase [Bacteroidales bacterium]